MQRWGILLHIGVCLISAACSLDSSRNSDITGFDVPRLDQDRQAFLRNFPLLDVNGQMKPPMVAATGKWPMGALIYLPPSGRGGFCSVSHIAPGKVAANAHCVEQDGRAYNYFVVFYDVKGQKTYDQVKAIEYQGSSSSDDLAVLSLSKTGEDRWHVLHAKIFPTQASAGAQPPIVEKVSIWAFNPTPGPGMKFEPRSCSVSRTAPRVVGITKDVSGNETARVSIGSTAQERLHLFVDGCDEKMVKGNSGSLISASADYSRVLGVYHWIVMPDKRYSTVEYTGNNGQPVNRLPDEISNNGMYGVGTAFEAAFANRPSLLGFFQSWTFDMGDID